jgi:phosphate transport system substrate-binding protein
MYKIAKKPDGALTAMEFFKWALENGQVQAETLDYVPLPSSLVQQIETYWRAQFSGWKG